MQLCAGVRSATAANLPLSGPMRPWNVFVVVVIDRFLPIGVINLVVWCSWPYGWAVLEFLHWNSALCMRL
jgi:hypothetical protein